MRRAMLAGCVAGILAVAFAPPALAQESSLVADLVRDVEQVEEKLLGLARAIPEGKYDWRPGEGVRSVGEVFLHVAADNYFIPAVAGTAAPQGTGIKTDDYGTVQAYEARKLGRDAIITELEQSFAFLKQAMTATTAAQLADSVSIFGSSYSVQQWWVLTATHMHEHLGQQIAYARTNGVVPPWSRGGM